jgi:tetratricopeptide (TPR) repeat protein
MEGAVMKLMTKKNVCSLMAMVLFAAFGQGASHRQQSDAKPQKPKESLSKENSSNAPDEQAIRTQQRKERALYLLESLADINLDDKVGLAHMKSDFAALMCACGERDKATEIFKKSLTEITINLLEKGSQNGKDIRERSQLADQVREAFDLALRITESATECNPTFRKWAANELEKLQASEKEKNQNQTDGEPSVIPDVTWGTAPSMQRQLRAAILYKVASQKMEEEKIEEAVRLLDQSLKICVGFPVMNALSRVKQRGSQDMAASLYLQAAHRIQTLPSGSELDALHRGLDSMLAIRIGQGITLDAKDVMKNSMIEAYLDALSALLHGQNAVLVSQSSGIVSLMKEALPLYAQLRPTTMTEVEQWLAKAPKRLSPSGQAAVEERPFAESPENFVARIQEIAAKTVDAKERDQAYAAIASKHIDSWKFDLAVEAIAKISDLNLKQELSDAASSRKISVELRKDSDLNLAKYDIEKIASLPMRVKMYLQLAKAAAKKDLPMRKDSLEEAVRLCEKIGTSTTVQAHLLLAIVKEYAEFDPARAFEILRDVVQVINKTTEPPVKRWGKAFTSYMVTTSGKFPRMLYESPHLYQKPYDFSTFRQFALIDFEGALLCASAINDKSVRASAEFEICASLLLQGKPSKSRTNEIPPPQ